MDDVMPEILGPGRMNAQADMTPGCAGLLRSPPSEAYIMLWHSRDSEDYAHSAVHDGSWCLLLKKYSDGWAVVLVGGRVGWISPTIVDVALWETQA